MIDHRVNGLSAAKRALLEERLLGTRRPTQQTIPRRAHTGPAPLSSPQQRLWFLEQLAPGRPTYNSALAMRVTGRLEPARLAAAVRAVIERHETLRTVVRAGPNGAPQQHASGDWEFAIEEVDLSGVPGDRREQEAYRLARAEGRRPFDLSRDLLIRLCVFRMAPSEHVLLIVEHHIAFDGWSDERLFAELAELYDASAVGRAPLLPELPIQYVDWAVWQNGQLRGVQMQESQRYWRRTLAGAPPLLDLPADHPRPQRQTFAGAHHHFGLPGEPAAAVRTLAQEEAGTPFMVLVAAFAAALSRWSGKHDIVLGSPIAGRDRVELEPLIGLLSNTFVLRLDTSGDPSLRELVRRTRESAIGAFEHQALPFEKLVEVVRPPRDPRCNPIFQVNVRVRNQPPAALVLNGLRIERFDIDLGFSRFDLSLELHLDGERITGYLEYNQALFEDATARRLAGRLARLTVDGLARPDVPISALDWGRAIALGPIRRR